jgi:hypothetical protein
MTEPSEQDRLSSQLMPGLRFSFGLAISIFVLEVVWGVQHELGRGTAESRSAGGYAAALTLICASVATAYVLQCISSYHHVVNRVEGWSHPISPRRAVRFHFIPLFNLYWDFKWPVEMARFVNWRMQRRRMSGILVGSLVLAGFLLAGFFDLSIGLTVILCTSPISPVACVTLLQHRQFRLNYELPVAWAPYPQRTGYCRKR